MPRFFCENITENQAFIEGEDAKHISKVLRCKAGDELTLCDTKGTDYLCRISELGETVVLDVLSSKPNETEPSVKITLYQALPKGDKLDFIVQKSTELGVFKIVPVMTEFCVAKADKTSFQKKQQRLNKIAREASKQSGRGIIPTVENIITFDEALKSLSGGNSIFCYEQGGEKISKAIDRDVKEVNVFVGSEGGFSKAEAEKLIQNGVSNVTLGRLILRCETAPIAAITLLLNATGDL